MPWNSAGRAALLQENPGCFVSNAHLELHLNSRKFLASDKNVRSNVHYASDPDTLSSITNVRSRPRTFNYPAQKLRAQKQHCKKENKKGTVTRISVNL